MVERFGNVLAIIPARRESKRLPGKNKMMLSVGGLPLWGNTVDIALNAGINNIAVSTDDNEILDKIELLFPKSNILGLKRSPEMSDDDASTEDVIREVMQQVAHQELKYDTICLLQPTSPTLQPSTLKHAIHQYYSNKYPCLVAVNPDFKPCGAFYIFNRDSFYQNSNIWMPGMAVYTVDEKESVDIDHIWDFRIAEAVMDGLVIKK
jgi:CMP-N-acetylneuraminic acid synthetase